MSTARALVAATALVSSALLGIVVDSPLAGAWTDGVCPTASGVTVVVDFQELGGGVQLRCANDGPVQSGFDALQRAGFTYQTAARSSGFLCRISGKPTDDLCINPSPTTAYWSYWSAARGGDWCYSNLGATRRPPEGTVEGWSFSLDRDQSSAPRPRVTAPAWVQAAPTVLRVGDCTSSATTPTTTPSTSPTAPARPSAPVPGGPASALSPAAPLPGAGGSPPSGAPAPPSSAAVGGVGPTTVAPAEADGDPASGDGTATTAALSGPASAPGASTTAHDEVASAGAAAKEQHHPAAGPAGSPLGVIAAVVLVAALTVTSVVVRRRVTASG
ncbi:MAG: hypothetical protein JST64_05855 [Actinobacteria bacterium]|nr:hypothetical protein [Actinomycetota bacterium]